MVRSLCRQGETVHLVCQENDPAAYDFIGAAFTHKRDGGVVKHFERETPYRGSCVLHKPELDGILPVFVWDEYAEHSRVVPMIDLANAELEAYIARNVMVVEAIVDEYGITGIHANHAVLMPTVAQRVRLSRGIPFTIMPHGSDIEYAVKKDPRFLAYASSAIESSGRVFVIGDEMRERVRAVFHTVPELESKLTGLHLGVDTSEFEPVERDGRRGRIQQLIVSAGDLAKGKTARDTARMRDALRVWAHGEPLAPLLHASAGYDPKKADADIAVKLERIDWSKPTVLFVGRLIAAKGIQSVIAALPAALERQPDLQLIVVGHGPLRELMEAFIFALSEGRDDLLAEILEHGRLLEQAGSVDPGYAEVSAYMARLREKGGMESYQACAQSSRFRESITFTGYLTHHELKHLFACCDVGIFPSVVREAGPLVFLEAIASGCLPMGTYMGGMAASIDAVSDEIGSDLKRLMGLSPERTADDIAAKLPDALHHAPEFRLALADVARKHYDWSSVSTKLRAEVDLLSGGLHQ
ncbi:MAG: glycosyltransferase family 4 protein [Gemmatimonadaceae bacterium]|nr:glycosyltransferase family 4 protein [Gemmatimonadaceae bacterium]